MINPLGVQGIGSREPVNPLKPKEPIEKTLQSNPKSEFAAASYKLARPSGPVRGGIKSTMV